MTGQVEVAGKLTNVKLGPAISIPFTAHGKHGGDIRWPDFPGDPLLFDGVAVDPTRVPLGVNPSAILQFSVLANAVAVELDES